MPAVHRLADELEQRVQFCGCARGFVAEQPEVTAGLAQAEQGGEHAHAGGAARFLHGIHLGARGDLELGVNGFLRGRELDLDDLFDLVGKLGEEIGFFPAEHPGADPAVEAVPERAALALDERFLVAFLKILPAPEISG